MFIAIKITAPNMFAQRYFNIFSPYGKGLPLITYIIYVLRITVFGAFCQNLVVRGLSD